MKIIYIPLAVLLSVSVVFSEEQYHVKTHSQGRVTHTFAVAKSKADKCPRWIPGEQQPPLSLPAACEIALAWAKANRQSAAVSVRSIELKRFGQWTGKLQPGADPAADKPKIQWTPPEQLWFYFIEFDVVAEGQLVSDEYCAVIVLMDGSTIGPEVKRK